MSNLATFIYITGYLNVRKMSDRLFFRTFIAALPNTKKVGSVESLLLSGGENKKDFFSQSSLAWIRQLPYTLPYRKVSYRIVFFKCLKCSFHLFSQDKPIIFPLGCSVESVAWRTLNVIIREAPLLKMHRALNTHRRYRKRHSWREASLKMGY